MSMTKDVADNVDEGEEVNAGEGYKTRRAIVRINYMAQDICDISWAARLLSKHNSILP